MKLRTLQTVDGLGAGPANTVVMFPVELTEAIQDIVKSVSNTKGSSNRVA